MNELNARAARAQRPLDVAEEDQPVLVGLVLGAVQERLVEQHAP